MAASGIQILLTAAYAQRNGSSEIWNLRSEISGVLLPGVLESIKGLRLGMLSATWPSLHPPP